VMADDGEDDLFPIAVLIDELKTDDTQVDACPPPSPSDHPQDCGRHTHQAELTHGHGAVATPVDPAAGHHREGPRRGADTR
jgi:hypothetical protein